MACKLIQRKEDWGRLIHDVNNKSNGKSLFLMSLFILVSCTGCFPLTHSVANIGVRQETLYPRKVLVATNGAVMLECDAVYNKKISIGNLDRPSETFRSKKYLLGSPNVVCWTIANAITSNKSDPRLKRQRSQTGAPTNLVIVTGLVYATTNRMNWTMITASHGGRDATLHDLPSDFQGLAFTNQMYHPAYTGWGMRFTYMADGQNLLVELPYGCSNPNRTSRKWWGYPLQILLIPAPVADIICSPFYFYSLGRAISEIRG